MIKKREIFGASLSAESLAGELVDFCGKVDIPKQGAEVGKDDSKIGGTDVIVGKVCGEPKDSVLKPERKEL